MILKKFILIVFILFIAGAQFANSQKTANNTRVDEGSLLKRRLIEKTLTLVENKGVLPLQRLDTLNIASIAIGDGKITAFQESLSLYANVKDFSISKNLSLKEFNKLSDDLQAYNLLIVSIQNTNENAQELYGITTISIDFIKGLVHSKKVVLDIFADPYSLVYFNDIFPEAIIMSYTDDPDNQDLSAQLIFGGISASGKLLVNINRRFKSSTGIIQEKSRLKFGFPGEINVNIDSLNQIDTVINNAIKDLVFPGCQVLCAKDGIVFYNKSFGYHTYDSIKMVQNDDIYDLASITKIAASTLSLMKLKDDLKFDPEISLSNYLCDLDTTDKNELLVTDVLSHQARLISWIPFYRSTIGSDSIHNIYYSKVQSDSFSIKIADSLYLLSSYRDTIYKKILDSPLRDTNDYLYSDLGFYLLKNIIESIIDDSFPNYLNNTFYSKLGMNYTHFNPIYKYPFDKITPTETDTLFRNQVIQGYVHDPGAAMLGGYSGHAGLFANANDLAKMMQMLLNKGTYGNEKYLNPETIDYFTSCKDCSSNRRALGFDKPELDQAKDGPAFKGISASSFGHSGFTGTYVWADPDTNLIYVFLSNRTYPDESNNKLSNGNYRTRIFELFYNAIAH